jgi:hypothetical protein
LACDVHPVCSTCSGYGCVASAPEKSCGTCVLSKKSGFDAFYYGRDRVTWSGGDPSPLSDSFDLATNVVCRGDPSMSVVT